MRDLLLEQMDGLLKLFDGWRSKYTSGDVLRELRYEEEYVKLTTQLLAAIQRAAPTGSRYRDQANTILKLYLPPTRNALTIIELFGVLKALRDDYSAGYLKGVTELIHADVFTDFLEMADHLLSEGYKDPGAVLAGGVLEAHLRKLADAHRIVAASDDGRPKTADHLNGELASADVYSKGDQKSVTAWLALRNLAAHGKYDEYSRQQVALLVQSVRDFIARHPA